MCLHLVFTSLKPSVKLAAGLSVRATRSMDMIAGQEGCLHSTTPVWKNFSPWFPLGQSQTRPSSKTLTSSGPPKPLKIVLILASSPVINIVLNALTPNERVWDCATAWTSSCWFQNRTSPWAARASATISAIASSKAATGCYFPRREPYLCIIYLPCLTTS